MRVLEGNPINSLINAVDELLDQMSLTVILQTSKLLL